MRPSSGLLATWLSVNVSYKHVHTRTPEGTGSHSDLCPHPLLVSSEPCVHCTRVIAMGVRTIPRRLARAADSQLCRTTPQVWSLTARLPRRRAPVLKMAVRSLSTVACGSNHNRPFKQPSFLTAGINEVLDFISRGRSRNHGRRPSFLLPSRKAGATSDLSVRNSQFMKSRHDWMQCDDKCSVSKTEGFSLPLIGFESERSLGHLLLTPQRLQVNVSLFTQSSSLGDSPNLIFSLHPNSLSIFFSLPSNSLSIRFFSLLPNSLSI